MENLTVDRLTDWLLLVAALVVSMAIFYSLERILRALFVPFGIVAIVLIVAKIAFDIPPDVLWHNFVLYGRKLIARFM
jgi:hypothetical protein